MIKPNAWERLKPSQTLCVCGWGSDEGTKAIRLEDIVDMVGMCVSNHLGR